MFPVVLTVLAVVVDGAPQTLGKPDLRRPGEFARGQLEVAVVVAYVDGLAIRREGDQLPTRPNLQAYQLGG